MSVYCIEEVSFMSEQITEKFQEGDRAYLAKRKEISKQLGLPDLWMIADHFGLYAGMQFSKL